ncbi:MAG: DUF1800 domain-containing protein [Terracidiphilus sp.]|jgi:uncharacterized protein (DUF1800 family)
MERFSGPITAIMCASLLLPSLPAPAETMQPTSNSSQLLAARPAYKSGQMQGDERIIHALNRFTFGPRPGDLEAVKAMGLEAWFNQQLRPDTIDQAELSARLGQFPAMQRNPQDLLYYLPSNAVIRQAIDGKAPVPDRPAALHAIYEDEMARVEVKRQEKEQQKQLVASNQPVAVMTAPGAPPPTAPPAMSGSIMADAAPAKPIQDQQQDGQPSQTKMAAAPGAPEPVVDPATITEVLALPPQQRVSRLAFMPQPELDALRKALKGPQRAALVAGLNPAQKEFVAALESPQRVVNEELTSQRLVRDIYSNAQLEEVMTDFWLNHFNVYVHKDEATPYYLVSYERDVIRPRALGKFEDLLEATAHSPAMLLYLDNSSSMGPDSPAAEKNKERDARNPNAKKKAPEGLNENYARELMELHTLGVNGGYSQADVTQVARVLTGWTVDRPQRGGAFKFDESRHEPGTKKVMGKKFKEHGEQEGRELLHMLATRPATAHFLSRKLAIRFVGDNPPQTLVDRMAKSYLSSGGDISTVLKTLFHSPEFWSEGDYRAKVKTPLEFVVSAARASNLNTDNFQPLINALRDMGMPLYGAIPPTGYKWDASDWVSTGALVNRMNFALTLASNKLPGIAITWSAPAISFTTQATEPTGPTGTVGITHTPVVSTAPLSLPTPAVEEQRLESLLVAGGVSDSTRSAVLEQFQTQVAQNNSALNTTSQNADPAKNQPPPKPVLTAATKPVSPAQATAALEKQDQLLAGLLLGSPEFQRR